jgi:hypothetical protein
MGGTEEYEELKECGCVITQWFDDWNRAGSYIKKYCENHRLENIEKDNLNKLKLKEWTKEYKIKPSKELVNNIIQVQLSLDKHHIFCICCNKQYYDFSINIHIKSNNHQNKLNKLSI